MTVFTLFYMDDSISNKALNLINKFNIKNSFRSIYIKQNHIEILNKHIKTIPSIINNQSNIIIEKDQILEFIIRLGLHIKKQEVLPYYKEPSLYTGYYSKFDDTSETDNENNHYSDSAFHYLNNEIPKIKTLTEITTLNSKDFNKKYNKLMNERNY